MPGNGLSGRSRAGWAVVAVVLLAVIPASSPSWPAGTDGATGVGAEHVDLPELPSLHERSPELYDERDCLRVPPDDGGEADCGAEPPPGETEAVARVTDRNLAGFRGPHYTTDVTSDDAVVLDSTVRTSGKGEWVARGLVRNETSEDVGQVTVHAQLVDEHGVTLSMASAAVPVDPVRPGEPAPFVVDADVPADEVSEVRWAVEPAEVSTDSPREAELLLHWLRSHGGSRDVAVGNLLGDEDVGERPYLLFGSVRNHADSSIERPAVVIAWLGPDGRVLHVAETPVVRPGSGERLPELEPGMPQALGDFLHAEPADPGEDLSGRMPMLWVVGS
ncbi:hypothetical protein SAMN06265360_105109 [Haloechinothrix alba]|uniref:Uncharacterized protein n=1 Tax=Haloechinothrix alba TaxID=664784 RepID=A0A238W4Y3_9PSEU|nr:FxLYD domain-containing protein [Haloechinothrix alba]SNR41461.1 hypothetical protein SAMN06265360_105109 [Haloechinothrix alba]